MEKSRINKTWHQRNIMPKNPTLQQRIQWHRTHSEQCACRPVPEKLLSVAKKMRGHGQRGGNA